MNDRTPTISIGMPVYDGEKYIREALDSLLGQTFRDFELIISDNASADSTGDICREYAARDRRVKYSRNDTNRGLVANYNRVFERAGGRYFKWASANDICEPSMLECCFEKLESDPAVVLCYARTILFDEESGTEVEYQDGLNLMSDSPARRVQELVGALRLNNAMNGLIRMDALRRTHVIAPFLASDVNLLLELALLGKFYEVPKFLFRRRVHPHEASRSGDVMHLLKIYDPTTKQRRAFTFWRLNWEHLKSIERSPIGVGDKLRLTLFISRKFFWDRRRLAAELVSRKSIQQAGS